MDRDEKRNGGEGREERKEEEVKVGGIGREMRVGEGGMGKCWR